jgi:hypothetical protein
MERFWSKVDKSPGHGPWGTCWIWTGFCDRDGYGRFKLNGVSMSASRAAWVITHGELPPGVSVLHRCDYPPCVRHLFTGTQGDNVADMIAKGRARYVEPTRRLTIQEEEEVRVLAAHLSTAWLARRYRVGRTVIERAIAHA